MILNEWMASDKLFKVTESCFVEMAEEKLEEEMQLHEGKISHSEGATLRYTEQHEEAMPIYIILFKHYWCDIITKNRSQLQKQKTLYNFFP